jgi:hypothetical protein
LRAAATAIRIEPTALPVSVAGWHVAYGEWCLKETLGHIIETEQRGFAGRIKVILDGDDPSVGEWDQKAVARERRDGDNDLATLLDEFPELLLDQGPMSGTAHRDGKQHIGDEDVARRPVDRVQGGV